ncbi:helix-turn-helix transcriptional regulator [Aeromicrobium duanguangcaii]|uniref:LuxR C-terminal-related transcriptional regulator n=1 Tax=Aeromicrobium duanguangcaii TaxID=2968086 RepID=A0ABY5KH88_9ACTN|nr:LuxR family transcriptional regulator [Aeromicrobium duanguangcaii]MCD9154538.1 LuxR C-terminal-related transcriptional regulator [Aeromicrobium duanguangcaii]UUI68406.1 LuxR C-terminal-related transcriptional regulator [Aeromicrobium duanguangcaii]
MAELVRPRLLARLDTGLPVVVVEALAGAGKRTLLRQWADEAPDGEVRLLVDVGGRPLDAAGVTSVLLAALDARGVLIDAVDAAQHPARAAAAAFRAAGPTRVALVGADRVEATIVGELVTRWSREAGVGTIVATQDATGLLRLLTEDAIAHRSITDAELRLDRGELIDYVRLALTELSEPAVDRLMELTAGTVGVVATLVRTCEADVRAARLAQDQVAAAAWAPAARPAGPFRQFLAAALLAPRFPLSALPELVTVENGQRQVERAVALGLADVTPSARFRSPVFRWRPHAREHLLRIADRAPEDDAAEHVRIAAIARRHGDHEQEVLSLVSAGDLSDAARAARERVWELVSTDHPASWAPLLELPVGSLLDFPSLACLRMVLRARLGHRVARSTVIRELERRTPPSGSTSPADRFHHRVMAFYVAVRLGELELAHGAIHELGGFAELWSDLDMDTGSVSDLLLAIEALVRIDRIDLAAAAARQAVRALELDAGSRTDPAGSRRAHAELVLEMCARHIGDLEVLARGPAPSIAVDPCREMDVVADAVLRAWEALDAGDPERAVDLTGSAMTQVDPVDWPLLLVAHALSAAGAGRLDELDRVWARYLKGRRWRSRHLTPTRTGVSARALDALAVRVLRVWPSGDEQGAAPPVRVRLEPSIAEATGRPLPLNDRLTNDDPALDLDALEPRAQEMALVMETTRAVRAGEPERALAALARASECAPGSGLVRVLLGTAAPTDLARLREYVAAGTGHDVHRVAEVLDEVVAIGRTRDRAPTLSEREREVLALVRSGRTNKEIAESLFLSVNTVKFHRANLYRKFDVDTRDRLVAATHRFGL